MLLDRPHDRAPGVTAEIDPTSAAGSTATGDAEGLEQTDPAGRPRRTATRLGLALAALAVTVAVGGAWLVLDARPTDHRYVIPNGSAARIDNGQLIDIIPNELNFKAGDTLTVVNHDSADHFVSATQIPAGETVTYTFPSPGVFDGACTVHPRGAVRIEVT